jgi:ribosomal protein L32
LRTQERGQVIRRAHLDLGALSILHNCDNCGLPFA